ncbi:MAG: methylated-DNA--[protein]-cysteine S-methyltransferase [Candidatus Hydrogenedentes bacterium]|nr:methylated-DNA--[protein]-cysteine S-methyltransferase [Candidatus Hydrogenedentota bacterium]
MSDDRVVYTYMKSPMGSILLARKEAGLTHICFQEGSRAVKPESGWHQEDSSLSEASAQLHDYFYGNRRDFDLPLAPEGTSFQQQVWRALQQIPCGETMSYGELAKQIGRPTASRAVGAANGRNPLPIVIPCHRVIGADGRLTGYAGGVEIKESLLRHEGAHYAGVGEQLNIV